MAKDGRDDEMDALTSNEELDSAKIVEQITGKKSEEKKSEEKKPEEKKPDEQKPGDTKDVPNPETIRSGILNEMFGDHFKTVEDVKKANIPDALKELENLRRTNQELSASLAKKPKHAFASDDIAKFNEFARETGIKDATVFNKLNAVDLANMPDIDALSLQHVIENPRLANRTPEEIRRYFERKYNLDVAKIDPKKVESSDLTQDELDANKREYEDNKMDMETDAEKAKTKLAELKSKIKMPETPAEETPAGKTKWTPEVEVKQKENWTKVGTKIVEQFEKIPLTTKNKEGVEVTIANFALPEKAKTELLNNALTFVVSNQLEVDEKNVTDIAQSMYSDIWFTYKSEILHTVFERARTMTEKEYLETYHNPSKKNDDQPDRKDGVKTEEDIQNDAFNMEIKR
jgi:hypothetical protein